MPPDQHGRRHAGKGSYHLCRADLEGCLPDCLVLLPSAPDTARDAIDWLATHFAGRAWLAVELLRDGGCRIRHRSVHARRSDTGYHAWPAVMCTCVRGRPCIAGRRSVPSAWSTLVARLGHARLPNGERHLRHARRTGRAVSGNGTRRDLEGGGAAVSPFDELRYEYPDDVTPAGSTPACLAAPADRAGHCAALATGCPGRVRAQIEHELALIAELRYEAYFLTVGISSASRVARRSCQGRGSAANSAVCAIASVSPRSIGAHESLLFERFIPRERNEPPDIDVDFEHQRREEVISTSTPSTMA